MMVAQTTMYFPTGLILSQQYNVVLRCGSPANRLSGPPRECSGLRAIKVAVRDLTRILDATSIWGSCLTWIQPCYLTRVIYLNFGSLFSHL